MDNGYLRGKKFRAIIPLAVSCGDEPRWVFFVVNSSALLTCFSAQVVLRPTKQGLDHYPTQASKYLGVEKYWRAFVKIGE